MTVDYDKDQLAYALANALKERDEAREDLEFRRGLYNVQEEYLETARRERDEAIEKHRSSVIYWQRDVFKMQRERDDALEEIQRLRLDAQREAEQHDRMVKELEGLYDQLAKTKSSNEHICSLSKDMMGNCIICDG